MRRRRGRSNYRRPSENVDCWSRRPVGYRSLPDTMQEAARHGPTSRRSNLTNALLHRHTSPRPTAFWVSSTSGPVRPRLSEHNLGRAPTRVPCHEFAPARSPNVPERGVSSTRRRGWPISGCQETSYFLLTAHFTTPSVAILALSLGLTPDRPSAVGPPKYAPPRRTPPTLVRIDGKTGDCPYEEVLHGTDLTRVGVIYMARCEGAVSGCPQSRGRSGYQAKIQLDCLLTTPSGPCSRRPNIIRP